MYLYYTIINTQTIRKLALQFKCKFFSLYPLQGAQYFTPKAMACF